MLTLLLAALSESQSYVLDSLPDLGYGRHSVAYGLNDAGDAVGCAQVPGEAPAPVIWRGGLVTALPLLPGDVEGIAVSLNSQGVICGYSLRPGSGRAVIWKNGGVIELENAGTVSASGVDINEAGLVAGGAYLVGKPFVHAARWDPATGLRTDLGTLGGETSSVTGVDAAGNAYGYAAATYYHDVFAVVWPTTGGPVIRLDAAAILDQWSIARGCSPSGLVIGDGYGNGVGRQSFAWSAIGGFRLIQPPSGVQIFGPMDVNDAGQAVFVMSDLSVWLHDLGSGSWINLFASLPAFPRTNLTLGRCINAAGQIAGNGEDLATGAGLAAWILSPAPDGFGLGEPFPAQAGAVNALGALGMTPGALVHLFAGSDPGAVIVPGCGGLTIGIRAPVLLACAAASVQGKVELTGIRPPLGLAGRRVLLQAVELSNCRLSNLSSVDFR